MLSAGPGGGRLAGHDGAGAGSITRRPLCCQLAQEAGGSLAMTEQERARLEQLLENDEEPLENAFSVDQQHRLLLDSLDDRLSVS